MVTGASSSLGMAISRRLIDLGFRVYGLGGDYRNCPLNNMDFKPINCDLSDGAQVMKSVMEIIEREGGICLVVNNAKFFPKDSFAEASPQEMDRSMRINLLTPLLIARCALPSLQRLQGFIINLGVSAQQSARGGVIGAATSGGLRWAHEALFDEVRDYGVKVSLISPEPNRRPITNGGSQAAKSSAETTIDPNAVAEAVVGLIQSRGDNWITELVIRPRRWTSSELPPVVDLPYPDPKPIPYTVPRVIVEAEEELDEQMEDPGVQPDEAAGAKAEAKGEPEAKAEGEKKRRRRRRRRSDKSDGSDRADESDMSDRSDRSDKSDISDGSDRSDRSDKSDESDRADKSEPEQDAGRKRRRRRGRKPVPAGLQAGNGSVPFAKSDKPDAVYSAGPSHKDTRPDPRAAKSSSADSGSTLPPKRAEKRTEVPAASADEVPARQPMPRNEVDKVAAEKAPVEMTREERAEVAATKSPRKLAKSGNRRPAAKKTTTKKVASKVAEAKKVAETKKAVKKTAKKAVKKAAKKATRKTAAKKTAKKAVRKISDGGSE